MPETHPFLFSPDFQNLLDWSRGQLCSSQWKFATQKFLTRVMSVLENVPLKSFKREQHCKMHCTQVVGPQPFSHSRQRMLKSSQRVVLFSLCISIIFCSTAMNCDFIQYLKWQEEHDRVQNRTAKMWHEADKHFNVKLCWYVYSLYARAKTVSKHQTYFISSACQCSKELKNIYRYSCGGSRWCTWDWPEEYFNWYFTLFVFYFL